MFETLVRREVLFGIAVYSLALGGLWGLWNVASYVARWFLHVTFCCREVTRLNIEVQRINARLLQTKLSSGIVIERLSIPPPLPPVQTSADWSDDHKKTEVKNT